MVERVFALPDPGEGLEEAQIVAWLVAEGDEVQLNQPIVEVETAKAMVEIPSPFAGIVARLHAAEGETVEVGKPLVTFAVVEPAPEASPPAAATPAVRKLARDLGVDLASIPSTGGRLSAEDVQAAAARATGASRDDVEEVALTPVRRSISERLTKVAAIPQVTTFRTLDCTELERFRSELGSSPLPVLVSALARTCRDHPTLSSVWAGDRIRVFHTVNVGIAVDTDRGLMVPVLRDAGVRGIQGIAEEIARLAAAARSGGLTPEDVGGATIAVSNTGSYGSEAGTPLLNPGSAVMVGLGLIQSRALVVDGRVVPRPACTLSLTFDHRVLDGAEAGRGLTDLVACLQDQARLRDLPR